jgi:hypothetical protein
MASATNLMHNCHGLFNDSMNPDLMQSLEIRGLMRPKWPLLQIICTIAMGCSTTQARPLAGQGGRRHMAPNFFAAPFYSSQLN